MEYVRKLWAARKVMLKAAGIGAIVGVIIALSIPKQYTDVYKRQACWTPVTEVKSLAFDHFHIFQDALVHIRHYVEYAPSVMFDLLPRSLRQPSCGLSIS